jgi:catalase
MFAWVDAVEKVRDATPTRNNRIIRADPRDPSQPWPDNRQVMDLGVLTLDKPVADSLEVQKKLLFLPTHLTDGIELSDDRLPVIRAGAYALSFARRGR